MSEDLVLTTEGADAIVIGSERYPVMFSIADVKAWAERKGCTFEDIMEHGWKASELDTGDIVFLLRSALRTGRLRGKILGRDEGPEVTDELVDVILSMAHPAELLLILVRLWSEPPARKPDPRTPESSPTGA